MTDIRINDILASRISQAIIFLTLASVVLFVIPTASLDPSVAETMWEGPKVISLIIGTVLLFLTYLVVRPKRSGPATRSFSHLDSIDYALIAYAFFWLTTVFVAENAMLALFGAVQRLDGTIYKITLVFFLLLLRRFLRLDKTLRQRFIPFLICLGAFQALLVVGQLWGFDFITLLNPEVTFVTVVTGTLGHPGFLANFLLFIAALALPWSGSPRLAIPLHILLGLAMGATQNRTLILAMVIVYGLGIIVSCKRLEAILRTTIIFVVAFVVTPSLTNIVRQVNPQEAVMVLERDLAQTNTLQTRLLMWRTALRCILERPLLGAGSAGFRFCYPRRVPLEEAFAYLFNEYPEDMLAIGAREITTIIQSDPQFLGSHSVMVIESEEGLLEHQFIMDKAHNEYLDVALSTGIPASLILFGLFTWPLWLLVRRQLRYKESPLHLSLPIVAVLIYQLAWFSVVQTEVIYLSFVFLVISVAGEVAGQAQKDSPTLPLNAL